MEIRFKNSLIVTSHGISPTKWGGERLSWSTHYPGHEGISGDTAELAPGLCGERAALSAVAREVEKYFLGKPNLLVRLEDGTFRVPCTP